MSENPKSSTPIPTQQIAVPPAAPKKTKERSPAYPAFGLRKALEYAKKLWDADKRQPAMVSRAITNLEYSAKSSGGALAIATLKKFGLLESEGMGDSARVKLTDSAISLINPSFPNRDQLLKTLALKPAIYADLWAKYGAELPSDGTIKDYLVFERHFFEEAVKSLIPSYKDTIEFVNLKDSDKVAEPHQNDDPPTDSGSAPQKKTPLEAPPAVNDQEGRKDPPRHNTPAAMSASSQELIDIPVPLPSGVLAYYRVPRKMAEVDFTFYGTLFEAYKPGLVGPERKYPAKAQWKNKDFDKEVLITGFMGERDGRRFFQSSDGTGIPVDELIFLPD